MFEYVKITDSDLHREHFTKHGLQVNIAGKEVMAQRMTDDITRTFSGTKTSPTILKWRQDITKSSQEGNKEEGTATHSRTSHRKRNQLIKK